jgi:predicted TIM-barrel fold metal-dependent hydrolase
MLTRRSVLLASIAAGMSMPNPSLRQQQIDDGRLLNQLPVWAPDAAIRKKILVDNPTRLYSF